MSTSLALIDVVEELSSNIDNKLLTVGVFIDLKKLLILLIIQI